jgi:hypothetical protein
MTRPGSSTTGSMVLVNEAVALSGKKELTLNDMTIF